MDKRRPGRPSELGPTVRIQVILPEAMAEQLDRWIAEIEQTSFSTASRSGILRTLLARELAARSRKRSKK